MNGLNVNLVFAWVWIGIGFVSGAALGLGFQNEAWLGGYGSLRRRLYRLGHISFFGLALLNLMFHFTAQSLGMGGATTSWASGLFIAGGVTMPLCCGLMAHHPRMHALFAVPVGSLLAACALTLLEVIQH